MPETSEIILEFPSEMKVYPKDDETIFTIQDEARTSETIFETETGAIHIVHEMTLGDVVVSTLLVMILVLMILGRIIRR